MPPRIRVWGQHDADTIRQLEMCARTGDVAAAALMADGHKGYSQPIGGVVAYRGQVSPSGVGFDVGCGNKAVRTDLVWEDIRRDVPRIMDAIAATVSFGLGRKNPRPVDHPLFDDPTWRDIPELGALLPLARQQLGTVGAGNHYVDLFAEIPPGSPTRAAAIPEDAPVWVGVHFGSRGFGFKTASGFLNLAAGRPFDAPGRRESMDQPPVVLSLRTELGQAYMQAMTLAGRYAYAGRDYVVDQVVRLLGARVTLEVHNHHNFAWVEKHGGEELVVVRKGATPSWPGQLSFIGGSMADIAVIVRGKDTPEAREALYSTVHGAGRIMSRTQAAGKWRRVRGRRVRTGGLVSEEAMRQAVREYGVELRGGAPDEAPHVYRRLQEVLDVHRGTLDIVHVLRPVGVAMAGPEEEDPYKD